ncbi:MAG: M48 family metallopeptidase [Alphaproteobacteria bacterium]|nr:M48 family metallopeptidase [Alphaproteobacteria bacterium]
MAAASVLGPAAAEAQGIRMIRDAEIEHTIRAFATPLLQAAGLDPLAVTFYLIQDDSLNAFVAGGQNMFLHTGLLKRVDSPNQLIGVMAHEIGHISGGHLVRMRDELDAAFWKQIATTLVGIAAGVATGRGDVGTAVMAGSQGSVIRGVLAFSRSQESQADQAGVRYLELTGQSSRGLADFLSILSGQELLLSNNQDPYVRTHPITRERIESVRAHMERSPYSGKRDLPVHIEAQERMRAKLVAYLESPVAALRRYPERDATIAGRYARAIAYFRQAEFARALAGIDGLIAERPNDPFFHEIRGEILYNSQRIQESVTSYRKAVALMPGSALLRYALAAPLDALGGAERLQEAAAHLEESVRIDRENGSAWRLLGIVYVKLGEATGRQDQTGLGQLALAEYEVLAGCKLEAIGKANIALRLLPRGSPGWNRAQDIVEAIKVAQRDDRPLRPCGLR